MVSVFKLRLHLLDKVVYAIDEHNYVLQGELENRADSVLRLVLRHY